MSKEKEKEKEKEKKIDGLPGKPDNKNVYLVRVEDITSDREGHRSFVTNKLDYCPGRLEFIGYEINNSSIAELKTYEDAIELANKNKSDLFSVAYPMQKIISVRNVTYKLKA